jgi:hypothetical protein
MYVSEKINVFNFDYPFHKNNLEDTKGVTRSRKPEVNSQKEKGQTTIYKTLHRKLKIGQHELH